jgi:hypothetical protein
MRAASLLPGPLVSETAPDFCSPIVAEILGSGAAALRSRR